MSKINDLFKRLAGKPKPPKEETPTLDDRETLCRNIRITLNKVVEEIDTTTGKQLVVWLNCNQPFVFEQYNTKDYRDLILNDLSNMRDYKFELVKFERGIPPEERHAFKICDNDLEYLEVVDCDVIQPSLTQKAIIRFLDGKVSPLQKEYLLSSDMITSGKIPAYNIGRGNFTQKKGVFRENHIVFDDSLDSPMLEHNRCVSRAHAHIGFDVAKGFTFQVDEGGARPGKTVLINGGRQIDCNCVYTSFQLQDGDKIIVKNGDEIETILIFNELNN